MNFNDESKPREVPTPKIRRSLSNNLEPHPMLPTHEVSTYENPPNYVTEVKFLKSEDLDVQSTFRKFVTLYLS